MIGVFVRDDNTVKGVGALTDVQKPLEGFFPAQARIDKDTRALRPDERTVPGTRTREHADLDDAKPPDPSG